MIASKLSLLLATTTALVAGSPLLSVRQESNSSNSSSSGGSSSGSSNSSSSSSGNSSLPTFPVGIVSATYDGELFYPKPIDNFNATKYVGPKPDGDSRPIWYQWAASEQPFLQGCRCVYARYGTNENGTVSVENFCTRGGRESGIKAYAEATPDYGNGTFQVAFFGQKPEQKGPNYVVTRAFSNKPSEDKERLPNADSERNTTSTTNDSSSSEEDSDEADYETVIVGSQNFSGWFLLSKTRQVQMDVVEAYLREVANAGFNLTSPYEIYNQTDCGAEPVFNPEA